MQSTGWHRKALPFLVSACVGCMAACSGSQKATYGRIHEGRVVASNVFGAGCPDDYESTRLFERCVARVIGQDHRGAVIFVGAASNAAFVVAVPCDADGSACKGESEKGTLRAGLFRVDSEQTLAALPAIQSLWDSGGRAAIFRDARCVPLTGSFQAETLSLVVLRAEFDLRSEGPVPPMRNRWSSCESGPTERRGPATIKGEIVQVWQRTDPGGALPF